MSTNDSLLGTLRMLAAQIDKEPEEVTEKENKGYTLKIKEFPNYKREELCLGVSAAQKRGCPPGKYFTIYTELMAMEDVSLDDISLIIEDVASCLEELLTPFYGKRLCIFGLVNATLNNDALGPVTIGRLPALDLPCRFWKVITHAPGVYAYNNIDTSTLLSGIVKAGAADCVILVDATSCSSYSRLGKVLQVAPQGVRLEWTGDQLNEATLGAPIISVGVPTTIKDDFYNNYLTLSNIYDITRFASYIISRAILKVLYPAISSDDLRELDLIELS